MYYKVEVSSQKSSGDCRWVDCICVCTESPVIAKAMAVDEKKEQLKTQGCAEPIVKALNAEECSDFIYEAYLYISGKKEEFNKDVLPGRRTA